MLARESLRKLAWRKSGFDVNPFYSSNILRVFAALNLSGIGLKQPTGKGIIGPRRAFSMQARHRRAAHGDAKKDKTPDAIEANPGSIRLS